MRLLVQDFEGIMRFCREVVGLELRFEAHGVYAEFEAGPARLSLYRRELMKETLGGALEEGSGDPSVLVFAVDSVDETFRRLVERGAEAVAGPRDQTTWEIRVAHLRDPEGNLFEIFQPLRQE